MNLRIIPHRFKLALAAAFSITAFSVGAYAYLQSRAPPTPVATEKLVIAAPRAPHAALLHIAAAKGYFAEEGLDVSIVQTNSGLESVDLVANGKADLATAAEVVVALAIMKGNDVGIVASIFNADASRIVARRDRGIAVATDLVGKKIGVTFGTSGEYFLLAYLIRNKISPAQVVLINLPPGEIPNALARGDIDATSTWQPIVLLAKSALAEGGAVIFTGDASYIETHVLVGKAGFVKKHPQAIGKLLRAVLKAEQFNRSQPVEALALVAERLKIDVEALRPFWSDFTFRVDLLQSQLITLEDEARWAMGRGYMEPGPVPNFLPHLYLDGLLAVRPERVTVVK